MKFYENNNYKYENFNSNNYDYYNVNNNQDEHHDIEEENEQQVEFSGDYVYPTDNCQECNCEECNCDNNYEDYCADCYKYKDIAGEKWEKSNELADCARKIGFHAKKAEEKAEYYKNLAAEEYEKACKLLDEYKCISSESMELMREARKYMAKFEECLQECSCNYKSCECNNNINQHCECKGEHKSKPNTGYSYPRW